MHIRSMEMTALGEGYSWRQEVTLIVTYLIRYPGNYLQAIGAAVSFLDADFPIV